MAISDAHRRLLDRLRGFVPELFGMPRDRLGISDLLIGRMIAWPAYGEPGVDTWYMAAVHLDGSTATIEHYFLAEDSVGDDTLREYGPFDLAGADTLDRIEECLRQIAQHPAEI